MGLCYSNDNKDKEILILVINKTELIPLNNQTELIPLNNQTELIPLNNQTELIPLKYIIIPKYDILNQSPPVCFNKNCLKYNKNTPGQSPPDNKHCINKHPYNENPWVLNYNKYHITSS